MALCQFSKMAIARQLRSIHGDVYSLHGSIPHFISFFSSPISTSPLRAASKQLLTSDFLSRNVSTTQLCRAEEKDISITFVSDDGEKRTGKGKVGDTLWDVMKNNGIQFEDFDRSVAIRRRNVCTICHMTFSEEDYKNLPTKPTKNELLNLECAYKYTYTSRLGCVIQVTEAMNGLEVKVPEFQQPRATENLGYTVFWADFMSSERDSCRYVCLNLREPVMRKGGKGKSITIGIIYVLLILFLILLD